MVSHTVAPACPVLVLVTDGTGLRFGLVLDACKLVMNLQNPNIAQTIPDMWGMACRAWHGIAKQVRARRLCTGGCCLQQSDSNVVYTLSARAVLTASHGLSQHGKAFP